jgi:hypothetical protein
MVANKSNYKLCIACLLATLAMAISLSILFYAPETFAQSDDLVLVKKSGSSKAATASEASRILQAQLTSEAAREQVILLIGEKRYLKNKGLVESKIIRQSAKFIPYVNPTPAVQAADGEWKMEMELRLSPTSIRKMVLDAGLLNDAEGAASLLPLVAFTDRTRGLSVRWWTGEPKDEAHKFLVSLSKIFDEKTQGAFAKEGFHVIKPQGTQVSPLPEPYRTDQPSATDLAFINDYFRTQMVLKGEVRVKDSKNIPGAFFCAMKLQVTQPASGRSIAEVSRQFVTEVGTYETVVRNKMATEFPDVSRDLATQVMEAWQRGTLNTNLLRLTVKSQMNPKQLAEFKTGLAQSVTEFKSLKERLFDNGQIVFEVDYTGQVPRLTERLRVLKLAAFDTRLVDAAPQNLTLEVRAK